MGKTHHLRAVGEVISVSDTDKQPDSEQLEEAVQSPENTANTEAGAEAQPQDDATATETNAGDELEALKEKLAQAEDQVLRAAAEAQNARRRAEQEVEKARKFALERFAGDLLPVVDNLERALDTVDQDDASLKAVLEGVELTRKSLLDTLTKYHVEVVDPQGEPFDPQFHEAMAMVPNPDAEPNSVIDVMQKGYTLNGRLLRAAMVAVAKAP